MVQNHLGMQMGAQWAHAGEAYYCCDLPAGDSWGARHCHVGVRREMAYEYIYIYMYLYYATGRNWNGTSRQYIYIFILFVTSLSHA